MMKFSVGLFTILMSWQAFAAPSAPTLTHSISGLAITASWTSVPGATEYKLSYAPIPYTGPESISSLTVKGVTSFTANLWDGAAFYIAVQAGDGNEFSEYSNIDNFSLIPASVDISGSWVADETWGLSNCVYHQNGEIRLSTYRFTRTDDGKYKLHMMDMWDSDSFISGSLVGNTATFAGTEDFSSPGVRLISTYSMNITILSSTELSGSYTRTDSTENCSATATFTATKRQQ